MYNICCYILIGVFEGHLHIYDTKCIGNIDVPIRAYCTLLGCKYLSIKTTRKVQHNFFYIFIIKSINVTTSNKNFIKKNLCSNKLKKI